MMNNNVIKKNKKKYNNNQSIDVPPCLLNCQLIANVLSPALWKPKMPILARPLIVSHSLEPPSAMLGRCCRLNLHIFPNILHKTVMVTLLRRPFHFSILFLFHYILPVFSQNHGLIIVYIL